MDNKKLAAAAVLLLLVGALLGRGLKADRFQEGRLDGCNVLAREATGGLITCVERNGKLFAALQGQVVRNLDDSVNVD